MVSLCSKTYVCQGKDSGLKFSCKGIQRNKLQNVFQTYRNVLLQRKSHGATNVGFRSHNNTMYTYSQYRNGLSYFYCKRRVCDDVVSTKPLDVSIDLSEQD